MSCFINSAILTIVCQWLHLNITVINIIAVVHITQYQLWSTSLLLYILWTESVTWCYRAMDLCTVTLSSPWTLTDSSHGCMTECRSVSCSSQNEFSECDGYKVHAEPSVPSLFPLKIFCDFSVTFHNLQGLFSMTTWHRAPFSTST